MMKSDNFLSDAMIYMAYNIQYQYYKILEDVLESLLEECPGISMDDIVFVTSENNPFESFVAYYPKGFEVGDNLSEYNLKIFYGLILESTVEGFKFHEFHDYESFMNFHTKSI